MTISLFIQDEIEHDPGLPKDRVTAVPWAPDQLFCPNQEEVIRTSLASLHLPFYFFVGSLEARKNLELIIKSMTCGCPVICSHAASLLEVAGDAALNIDPADGCTLADAMQLILADKILYEELQARDRRRATWFSWR